MNKNSNIKYQLLVCLFFIILISGITFPLLFNFRNYIPGFISTDEPYAALWDSWRIKHSFLHNLSLKETFLIDFPFGRNLYPNGYSSHIWLAWHHFLSIFTTPTLTYNIQISLNLFLSCIITYFLVLFLTSNILVSIFGGVIFAFCSYQFARIWQHLTATYNEWLPLSILLVFMLRKPDKKVKLFLFLTIIMLFSFDLYLAIFTFISVFTFFLYLLFYNWKLKLKHQRINLIAEDLVYIRRVSLIFLVFLIIYFIPLNFTLLQSFLGQPLLTPSAWNMYLRPFEDLFAQSTKPLSYLLPPIAHPLFGKFTEHFIGSPLYGDSLTEHALYLGWVPLILAFIAFRRWRVRRRETIRIGTVPFGDSPYSREDFYVGFFILLAIVAWLFSQPPWWQVGPVRIFMPSYFMYKILPMFRAYCRFGIVLMLAVAVLAGFGLKFILERFKSDKAKIAITALACGLVLFEFWNWPPYKVIDVSKVPAVYYWLKSQPKDTIIAEYPLDAISPNEMYKFYQTVHEKRMINSTIPGTEANNVARSMVELSSKATTDKLKAWGVKYVLVHHTGYLETDLMQDKEEFKKIPQNKGLELIGSFTYEECPQVNIMCVRKTGPIDVYKVR